MKVSGPIPKTVTVTKRIKNPYAIRRLAVRKSLPVYGPENPNITRTWFNAIGQCHFVGTRFEYEELKRSDGGQS